MEKRSKSSIVYELLLKIGVVFFLFSVFYNVFELTTRIQNNFWETTLKVLVIVIFFTLSLIAVALRRKNFRSYAFFVVFITSVFKIITFIANEGFDIEIIPVYVLLIIMSLYILFKASEHSSSHRR
jgi:hypothetical protein